MQPSPSKLNSMEPSDFVKEQRKQYKEMMDRGKARSSTNFGLVLGEVKVGQENDPLDFDIESYGTKLKLLHLMIEELRIAKQER